MQRFGLLKRLGFAILLAAGVLMGSAGFGGDDVTIAKSKQVKTSSAYGSGAHGVPALFYTVN